MGKMLLVVYAAKIAVAGVLSLGLAGIAHLHVFKPAKAAQPVILNGEGGTSKKASLSAFSSLQMAQSEEKPRDADAYEHLDAAGAGFSAYLKANDEVQQ